MSEKPTIYELDGFILTEKNNADDPGLSYDVANVAWASLHAVAVAVAAMEQVVTGNGKLGSVDVGRFYGYIDELLGEAVASSIIEQDNPEEIRDIIEKLARMILAAKIQVQRYR